MPYVLKDPSLSPDVRDNWLHIPLVNSRDKMAYTLGEAAGYLGVSKRRVRRLTARGALASFTMAGRRMVRAEVLRAAR